MSPRSARAIGDDQALAALAALFVDTRRAPRRRIMENARYRGYPLSNLSTAGHIAQALRDGTINCLLSDLSEWRVAEVIYPLRQKSPLPWIQRCGFREGDG